MTNSFDFDKLVKEHTHKKLVEKYAALGITVDDSNIAEILEKEKVYYNKKWAYEYVLRYISDKTETEIEAEYKDRLKRRFESDQTKESLRDYSFPEERRKIDEKYECEKNEIIEMFNQGDLLTFPPYSPADGTWRKYHQQDADAHKKGKYLSNSMIKFPLQSDFDMAFFSNGRLLVLRDVAWKRFGEIAKSKGYPVKEPEWVDLEFIDKINAYARKIYADKMIELDILGKQELMDKLFKDGNVCLTASEELLVDSQTREYLALFSDGSFIVSEDYNDYRYNDLPSEEIKSFIKKHSKEFVFMRPKYVPAAWISQLYEKAANYSWFVPSPKLEPVEDIAKMETFARQLFENKNKCLSIIDIDYRAYSNKSMFALFADGRFIVRNDMRFPEVDEFETAAKKKWPNLNIVKEFVPPLYLKAIYEEAAKHQKTCNQIYNEMLKKDAKLLSDEKGIPHHLALEEVAQINGFNNWKEVTLVKESKAQGCITERTYERRLFRRNWIG